MFLVRETSHYLREEIAQTQPRHTSPSFRGSLIASLRDRTLLSCSQAGLVTKINDATAWGLVPLFLAAQGMDVVNISIIAAIYPQVWGLTQLGTGFLSDHLGRKPLIVAGMLLQGLGISLMAIGDGLLFWIIGSTVLGVGTAAVYPTLIAAVGDHSHPMRRASQIGIYRWYRDGGFIVGGLLAGLMADAQEFRVAFLVISGINIFSAFLVVVLMVEPLTRRQLAREPSAPG